MLKKIVAVLLTMTLVISSSVLVMAEAIQVTDGSSKTVEGDVTIGEGEYHAVLALNESEVHVTGDASGKEAVYVGGGSTVTVDGNANGEKIGICSDDGGIVEVGKNVTGGIFVTDAVVTVGGDVSKNNTDEYAPAAIQESGDSLITIGGDVTSSGAGIMTDGDSVIAIDGTLTTSKSDPVIIVNRTSCVDNGDYTYSYSKKENARPATIVVYEIKGNLDNLVKSGYQEGLDDYATGSEPQYVEDPAFAAEQIKNIFYIIRKDENVTSLDGARDNVPGCAGYCAPENTVIKVSVKEGYGLSAGSIKVTKNSDGSYSITVPRGGGVTLTTEQIEQAVKEIEKQESFSDENENKAQTQAVPVAATLSATVDPVTMGEAAYVSKVTSMIASAPYGGTVELNVTSEAYLTDLIISALETRSDVSLKINVTVNGVPYVLNIPAGFNLRALMGPDGKIDIQKLIDAFGKK